jgi:hypothetical protein
MKIMQNFDPKTSKGRDNLEDLGAVGIKLKWSLERWRWAKAEFVFTITSDSNNHPIPTYLDG